MVFWVLLIPLFKGYQIKSTKAFLIRRQIKKPEYDRRKKKGPNLSVWPPKYPLMSSSAPFTCLHLVSIPCGSAQRVAPNPHRRQSPHTQAGTKRPTSVWPYQCHRIVWQPFRVHEVSLVTMRSIAWPNCAAASGGPSHSQTGPQVRRERARQIKLMEDSRSLSLTGGVVAARYSS